MPYKTIQQSLEATDSITWIKLGSGNYNQTDISTEHMSSDNFTGQWVLKKPMVSSDAAENALNSTDRAMRKWDLHNPEYPAHKTSDGGWVIPYFGNTPASDQQISEKLIEIYHNTGNIISDACGTRNFLIYQGRVICIDVDFSLRRGSFASDLWLDGSRLSDITKYLDSWSQFKPKTTSMIRTLLYLDKYILSNPIPRPALTKPCVAEYMHMLLTDLTHLVTITPHEFFVMVEFIILNQKKLLNCLGANGYSLLHLAECIEDDQFYAYLLKHGANPSITIPSALPNQIHLIHIAASHGRIAVVNKLITHDFALLNALTPFNESPLLLAASQGHHALVDMLLIAGADVHLATQLPQSHAAYEQHHQYSALDWAITGGHSRTIEILKKVGAQANCTHMKIKNMNLQQMIRANNLDDIRILIQQSTALIHQLDVSGYSLLQLASAYNQTGIVLFLLDAGADINCVTPDKQGQYAEIRYPNMTAFEIAVAKSKYRCAILLLENGASVSQAIPGQDHPIHRAAKAGHIELVNMLLTQDHNLLHALGHANTTPLDYAIQHSHAEMILLLENAVNLSQLVQSETATQTATATSSWCAYLTHQFWSTPNDAQRCAETHNDENTEEAPPILEYIKRS
jgi:ankyrin repeat protein